MTVDPLVATIGQLFRRRRFLSEEGHPQPLHRVCECRGVCWRNAEHRYPPDDDTWSHISRPWIGQGYRQSGILAVAENLNEYGGLDALPELVEEAKELIAKGYRRVRFTAAFADYAGSFLWHRLGAYVALIAQTQRIAQFKWDDDYPQAQDVASAFELMAFTEHVKCSPKGDKSKPTPGMWRRCGVHVLREEISLLKPATILVLGKSANDANLAAHVFDSGYERIQEFGVVRRAFAGVSGSRITVFTVPHPQAYGGAAATIMSDLRQALGG